MTTRTILTPVSSKNLLAFLTRNSVAVAPDASGHRFQLEKRDLQWHERGDLAEVRRCDGQAGVEATL